MKHKFTHIYSCLIICVLLGRSIDVMPQGNSKKFSEPFSISYPIRVEQHIEVRNWIEILRDEKINETLTRFRPDYSSIEEYQKSLCPYQKELATFFGYPPFKTVENSKFAISKIGEDSYRDIYRASKFYENLGIGNRFIFHEHEGEHEHEVGPILDFFDKNL